MLWLRDREEWKAFVRLFVGLSFAALVIYALAARRAAVGRRALHRCRCRRRSVGSAMHVPSGPRVPDGGLLGAMQTTQDGANGWVERIVARGWGKLQPALAPAH